MNDTVKLADLENPSLVEESEPSISPTQAKV